MLTTQEKKFFADTAWGVSELSACSKGRKGAVIVRDRKIASTGYNRRIITERDWEVSAIYDAIFSVKHEDMTEQILFSTYFPSFDDVKLIVSVGITSIYWFGETDNIQAVELLNFLPKNSIPLKITHLK